MSENYLIKNPWMKDNDCDPGIDCALCNHRNSCRDNPLQLKENKNLVKFYNLLIKKLDDNKEINKELLKEQILIVDKTLDELIND